MNEGGDIIDIGGAAVYPNVQTIGSGSDPREVIPASTNRNQAELFHLMSGLNAEDLDGKTVLNVAAGCGELEDWRSDYPGATVISVDKVYEGSKYIWGLGWVEKEFKIEERIASLASEEHVSTEVLKDKLAAEIREQNRSVGPELKTALQGYLKEGIDTIAPSSYPVIAADICRLPFHNESVDYAMMAWPVGVGEKLEQAFQEMVRCVKPGGKIYFISAQESQLNAFKKWLSQVEIEFVKLTSSDPSKEPPDRKLMLARGDGYMVITKRAESTKGAA